MKDKPKKVVKIPVCDGINKAKGFDGCKKETHYRTNGLCDSCLIDFYFNDERGKIIYAKLKGSLHKTKEKAFKEKLKTNTTNWKDELQDNINKIIRYIDKDLLCLARNQKGQIHAGHVYARGGNSTIRYNLHNIHRQCAQSNKWQNDDGLLREGIINEYGQAYMDFIASLRQTPQLKYKEWQYKELSLRASKIALRLKKLDLTYDIGERMDLRNQINIELGIYDQRYCYFFSYKKQ